MDTLGVDIGGVIIDRVSEDGPDAPRRPVDGAFDAIRRLVAERFGERVWLVSRTDEEAALVDWLDRSDFHRITGVARERVRFCRKRHEKAAICRETGISHFVDDRLEVLGHLVGLVRHLYLLDSRAADVERFREALPHVRRCAHWRQIVRELLPAVIEGRDGYAAPTPSDGGV